MEKRILKIDIAELLKKYEDGKHHFYLVYPLAAIESEGDLFEVDLGYTTNSTSHADADAYVKQFKNLKEALRELRKEANDYYFDGGSYGNVAEYQLEIYSVDEDGEEDWCVEEIPCPNSNLEDFMKEWEKKIDDEFHKFTVVEWVNTSAID